MQVLTHIKRAEKAKVSSLRYIEWRARFVYRISSNNINYFWHKKGTIFRGRRLFQILLTGGRALNILFYFPIKWKNNHIKYTRLGLLSVPSLVPWKIFRDWIVIVLLDHTAIQLDREGIKGREDGERDGGRLFKIFPSKRRDYSREGYYPRKYGI